MISSLLQAIPAIITGLKGKNLKPQRQTLNQLSNLSTAQYDMGNPYFQQLYGQEREAGQQDLASTIAELSRQNRKAVALGRTPLLDQERGGESVFRNLIAAQQGIGDQARRNTFGQLRNAQSGLNDIYNNQGGLADREYENKGERVTAYANIGEVLKKLFGI